MAKRTMVSHPVACLTLIALVSICGCARKRPIQPVARPIGWTQTGEASWYGNPYHGRKSASGEIYDMEKLTAAHRTLPFETWVRVRNLENDKTVDVRITDRGPFAHGRIIDLSRAAARAIGMLGPGVVRVRLEVIQAPAPLEMGRYAVQVGAFEDRRNAERMRERMSRYGTVRLVPREASKLLWRVLVGAEPSEEEAEALAGRIRQSEGIEAFVVRVDEDET